jgi:hypothetical protein
MERAISVVSMSTEAGVIGLGCSEFSSIASPITSTICHCRSGSLLPLTEVHQLIDVYWSPA